MAVDLLLGLQWGDEGKGKIVDVITSNYDIIARFQGGPNAGHTLEFDGIKHVLRTIPSGIFHKKSINVIGNGVVIDPVVFVQELDGLDQFNLDYKLYQPCLNRLFTIWKVAQALHQIRTHLFLILILQKGYDRLF